MGRELRHPLPNRDRLRDKPAYSDTTTTKIRWVKARSNRDLVALFLQPSHQTARENMVPGIAWFQVPSLRDVQRDPQGAPPETGSQVGNFANIGNRS
jgi:hypothetical protein